MRPIGINVWTGAPTSVSTVFSKKTDKYFHNYHVCYQSSKAYEESLPWKFCNHHKKTLSIKDYFQVPLPFCY